MMMKYLPKTLVVLVTLSLLGCGGDNSSEPSATNSDISAAEAQAIARDAYAYGFPMVMNLKTIYDYTVDVDSPSYTAAARRSEVLTNYRPLVAKTPR